MLDESKRKQLRFKGFDYSESGAYYVTICTHHGVCLFGSIVAGCMTLNDSGQMVEYWWKELSNKFPMVKIDTFVVMPNHFHGVLWIMDEDDQQKQSMHGRPHRIARTARLGDIIGWFKTITTELFNILRIIRSNGQRIRKIH